jgi:DNA replication protein DnaC
MNEVHQLKPRLNRLKLSGILNNLELRIREAQEGKVSYSEFLLALFQDEVERRDAHALALRMKRGKLDPQKTIESFDFAADPKLPRAAIMELASCEYIDRHENVILAGPSGVGKTHLAYGLAHEAARRGYDVYFDRAGAILSWLHGGRGDGSFDRRFKQIVDMPLLVIDDFGLLELSTREQIDIYEIVCGRYERRSTIITSNRDVSEWFSLFHNPLLGSAIIDRLVHRGVRLTIEADSFRLKESQKINQRYADFSNLTNGKM